MMQDITWFDENEDDFTHNGLTLYDFADEPEINRVINNQFVLTGTYQSEGLHAKKISNGNILRAYCPDRSYQLFRIVETKPLDNVIQFIAFHIAWDINNNFIIDFFESNGSGSKIMSGLQSSLAFKQRFEYSSNVVTTHQFTAKEGNPIDILQGSNNGGQNLVGVTGGELDFDNFNIRLLDRLGIDNGFRVDFRINLDAVESLVDDKSVKNSLYLIGETPEGDYDADQEPIKYFYLERPGVTEKNRRIGKRTNSECKTKEELIKWGNELFDKNKIHVPNATHIISMIDLSKTEEYKDYKGLVELNIGDTVHVNLKESHEEVEERMIEYTWYPRVAEYKQIVLGTDLGLYSNKTNDAIQNTLKELEVQSNILNDKILNATNLITGTSGGHVVFRPKNKPSEILIMDSPDVNKAKQVWRWNLGGLGHSKNGVNGPFTTAMTSDGQIVANVITAGKFNAEMLRIGFNDIGDTLVLVSNALQIQNNKVKIMELTKKGLEFWRGTQPIGVMGTTGDNFSWVADYPGQTDRAILIGLNGGDFIKISNDDQDGIFLPKKGMGRLTFSDKRGIDITNQNYGISVTDRGVNVVGELLVNGQPIGGGSGGGSGGWNGTYPPEVVSQSDKFAWILWSILLSLGYSKAAAAGILGNVQGEVGAGMNPDTVQVGGPGYGIVQWDGSAYPLIGAPTYNGREYVQRLINAANIKENYTTMQAQAKLVDWSMTNGQWIGQVNPTTVSGFKNANDPANAAYAFEKNFERPRDTHPERQGYAVNWFNKFKDLKAPGGKYGMPVAPGYQITSWFGDRDDPLNPGNLETHKGMDFADKIGSPIFAAENGEVIASLPTSSSGGFGEYIVIKHSDGNCTGYGHMTARMANQGQKVSKGQQIGTMGSTGNSTGSHLHFSVGSALWGPYQDPAPYLGLTRP